MSRQYFKDHEEYEEAPEGLETSEEQSQEESFPEPDFEEAVERTPLFTRETKIGLAVILVLVIVLGAVLVKRFIRSDGPEGGKQAAAKADSPKSDSSGSQSKTSSSSSSPKVVESRPGFSRQSPPSDTAPWVPSSHFTSREGGRPAYGGGASSDRWASPAQVPLSGSLTSVRPSEPVGNAWAASPPGTTPSGSAPSETLPRPSSGLRPPGHYSPEGTNPLRTVPPSEPDRVAVSPGSSSSQTSPNPSGYGAPYARNGWDHNPSRDGTFQQVQPSPSSPSSPGNFSPPYTPPVYSAPSSGYLQGTASEGASRSGPPGQSPLRNPPGPFSSAPGPSGDLSPRSSPGAGPPSGGSASLGPLSGSGPQNGMSGISPGPENRSPAMPPAGGTNTPTASSPLRSHSVQPGENYWTIAEKFYGTGTYYQALAEYNRSRIPPEQLRVGDQLLIPSREELERAYPHLCRPTTSPRTDSSSMPSGNISGGQPSANGPLSGRENPLSSGVSDRKPLQAGNPLPAPRVYVVQEGDTLYEIARYLLGKPTRWVEIYELNKEVLGEEIEHLRPGTRLAIPPAEPGGSPGPMSAVPPRPLPR